MLLFIFRLPFLVIETLLRRGLDALGGVLGLLRGDTATVAEPPRVAAERPNGRAPSRPGPPPPTAVEAVRRRRTREAAAPPPPATRMRPVAPEGHVDVEEELVGSVGPAEGPHADLRVGEPWKGYDVMPAGDVIARIRGADPATKAVVALYERTHKGRRTVLAAAGTA